MTAGVYARKAIDLAGGAEEMRRKSERYYANFQFGEENKADLIKEYDNHWVAIFDTSVIAHGNKLNDLMQTICKKNIPLDEVFVEYFSSKDSLTL